MGLKTKTVCVKKQRKLSKNIVHQQEASNGDEIHDTLLDSDADDKIVTGSGKNVISMESMVCLPDPSLTPLYLEAIKCLKTGQNKVAEDNLNKIIR